MKFSAFGLGWHIDANTTFGAEGMLLAQTLVEGALTVRVTDGPGLPANTEVQPGLSRQSDARFVFGVPEIARYNISAEEIVVYAVEHADPLAVQVFLWGSAVGTVLHKHGILPLHGSTVRLPDGTAAVFCGHSGAGKSTTLSALGQRGLACVADDVSAIHFDAQGQAWVYPGLPRTKLWGHALAQLGMIQGQQIRAGIDKYYVDVPLCVEPLRLSRMYELDVKQVGGVVMTPIEGMCRVTALLTHTYRPSFVSILGIKDAHMARVACLAPQLKMARMSRPRGESTLHEISEMVLRDCA